MGDTGRAVPALPAARKQPAQSSSCGVREPALAGWRTKYPDVVVHTEVVEDHPAALLVERSRQQTLIVVGLRGHSALPGILLRSVSQAVLHLFECPVAVIPAH